MSKLFVTFDSADPSRPRSLHYGAWLETIDGRDPDDRSPPYTEEEMLALPISETLKKRLRQARENTVIKLHYLHSCGDLCARRMMKEEINLLRELEAAKDARKSIQADIEACVPQALKDSRKAVGKVIKKLEKELKKTGREGFGERVR